MFALSHKRTFRSAIVMSAYPRKRTFGGSVEMSAKCQKRTHAARRKQMLFDHLAGAERQCWRDVQSDHVGGL
jgi:hypothetical protein